MRFHHLVAATALGAIALAACGGGSSYSSDSKPTPAAPVATATTDTVAVKSGDTSLGNVLVSPSGLTMYGFMNDTKADSTCFGTCATAWPPVLVDEGWTVAPGLDSAVFSTIIRKDGNRQLVAGQWPLYTFSGDAKPGDVNGQGSGNVWFAVGTDAKLVKKAQSSSPTTAEAASNGYGDTTVPSTAAAAAPAPAAGSGPSAVPKTGSSSLGAVLTDAKGLTLYGLTKDTDGIPTCVDACANAWPPLIVDGSSLAGLDSKIFSVVERPDGSHQLKAGKWPLYRFAGDAAPGDTNGQGSAGVWFVVTPNGSLNKG